VYNLQARLGEYDNIYLIVLLKGWL
jgi:hypothetical protein